MRYLFTLLAFLLGCSTILSSNDNIHHDLYVKIDHKTFEIQVTDTVKNFQNFIRNDKLVITINEIFKDIKIYPDLKFKVSPKFLLTKDMLKSHVIIEIPKDTDLDELVLVYSGIFRKPPERNTIEYARAGTDYPYLLDESGAYLSQSAAWFPVFTDSDNFMTFNLDIRSDAKYDYVSQGELAFNNVKDGQRHCRFECNYPMDDIYLISGPFTTFEEEFDGIKVQAYLRSNDTKLAMKYIKSTERFLDMYNELIGDYPYKKFTLVENNKQTGWGMPSFTLLGSKIIRFPFILYSSYPHELLHNWWGNSVYVDYSDGNWCEGLTSYLADHMLKEQNAQGAEYRKNALEKYTYYVPDGLDFTVNLFMSKQGDVSEAIGYSKVLMIFHMLRIKYGDDTFVEFLRELYKRHKFQKTSFTQLFKVFEDVSGDDLTEYYNQWIRKRGAPRIKLVSPKIDNINNKYIVSFELHQTQPHISFKVDVPVFIKTENNDKPISKVVSFDKTEQMFSFSFDNKPEILIIDPLYDVMRRLNPGESAPIISNLFGDTQSYLILPSKSKYLEEYKQLAEQWKISQEEQNKKIKILVDTDITEIPDNSSVWIIGKENLFVSNETFYSELNKYADKDLSNAITDTYSKHSSLVVFKNPNNKLKSIAYLSSNNSKAIAALTRKLPHYGKYSYLGFKGDQAENDLKGIFKVRNNPMIHKFSKDISDVNITEREPLIK